ncbi:hypothetical protein BDL97_14G079700 [Sphagnum fallax]|nr:hypothetical protein BDL97_14G079700 [Sphagnum fallax]
MLLQGCLMLLCLSWLLLMPLIADATNADGDALKAVQASLTGSGQAFVTWDITLVTPCTWINVACDSQNNVNYLNLGNQGLSGTLAPQIGNLPFLQNLNLQNNSISGEIPATIGQLTNLTTLFLYANNFTGEIPAVIGNLSSLKLLKLNNNSLDGSIPSSISSIPSLQTLDVSFNNLSGQIPSTHAQVLAQGNPLLCELLPGGSCPGEPSFPSSAKASTATGAIAGGVLGAVLVLALPALCFVRYKHRRYRAGKEIFYDVPGYAPEDDLEASLGQMKKFSIRQMQIATNNFSSKNVIGSGGFGKVYLGSLVDGTKVAVKRLKEEKTPGGEASFQTEVEIISMALHRNLLRLLGFCITPTERILVYPFMPNGSVADRLHENNYDAPPALDWPKRKHIALGAARGLSYLHEHCDPKIIHRDVKAANVLLDAEFEAVVGDFGLAKILDYKNTHVTTLVRGTAGHIAPEYLSTGKSSEKTDVFGYGIMLLELITGERAFDFSRLANDDDVMLLDWVKRLQHEKKLEQLVDAKLQKHYNRQEVEELIQVALLCTQMSPTDRPRMADVVRMLEGDGLAERWEEWQKVEIVRRGQEMDLMPRALSDWVEDSTFNMDAVELSAGR